MTETMKTLRFGIEIETVGLRREDLARAIHSAVGGSWSSWSTSVTDPTGRVWRVEYDGSLSGSNNGEIVSPILTCDDLDVLQAVVRAVARAGARADYSTGIHYARRSLMCCRHRLRSRTAPRAVTLRA